MEPEIERYAADDAFREEARRADGPRVRVYRPPGPAIVLGAGSRPGVELHLERCAEDRVAVFRRAGGGCAVVLDAGNVIVSVAYPTAGFWGNRMHFERISAWLIDALVRVGIPRPRMEGASDLAIADRKVAGACLHRTRDQLYYSASLLVDPDVSLIARYLKHPPREPEYRRGRHHLDFLRPLSALVPGATAARLEEALPSALDPSRLVLP